MQAELQDERMADTLDSVMSCMVITSPVQTGHPIVFATKGFAEMVGYHRDELLGKSVFQVSRLCLTCGTASCVFVLCICAHVHMCSKLNKSCTIGFA